MKDSVKQVYQIFANFPTVEGKNIIVTDKINKNILMKAFFLKVFSKKNKNLKYKLIPFLLGSMLSLKSFTVYLLNYFFFNCN